MIVTTNDFLIGETKPDKRIVDEIATEKDMDNESYVFPRDNNALVKESQFSLSVSTLDVVKVNNVKQIILYL